MRYARYILPAFMATGVTVNLWILGMPLWGAMLLVAVIAVVASAGMCGDDEPDEPDEDA